MDNLPAVQGQLISPPSAPRLAPGLCSPGLKRLLTEGEDAGGACRLITLNVKLRAEAQEVLPALQAAKAPADEEAILEILIRNAPAYGVNAPGEGGWMVLFGAYIDALEGLPAYAIEDAFLRWNRGEGHANLQMASFYPKPGQLVMLAQKGKSELYMAAYRAEKALAHAEKAAPRHISDEERKANGDALRELAVTLEARRVPPEHRPRISQHDMAERIRRAVPEMARTVPDDIGDVI